MASREYSSSIASPQKTTPTPAFDIAGYIERHNSLLKAEPDECFYIRNIDAVRGKKRLDLTEEPVPDLVVEVDVTSSSENRLQVYADLRVAEVWI